MKFVVLVALIPSPGRTQTAADSAFQRGEFAAAASGYEKIIARDAANGAAWFGLAASYQSLGNLPKAFNALTHARTLNFRLLVL